MMRAQMQTGRAAEMQVAASTHLRTAIGAYRGSIFKRLLLGGIALGGLFIAIAVVGGFLAQSVDADFIHLVPSVGPVGFMVSFASFMMYVFVPPYASAGAIAQEQAWMTSLPFSLRGYFEVMSMEPQHSVGLMLQITWRPGSRPPDPHLLQNVLAAADPHSRVEYADAQCARVITGAISGVTGIRVNRRPVYRNHKHAERIHAYVDRALMPLNQSHPIADVMISKPF